MRLHAPSFYAPAIRGGALPLLAAVFAALLAVGCAPQASAPTVAEVSPAWGYNGEPTEIDILGENLFPTVVVDAASADGGRIDGTFEAWLEGAGDPTRIDGMRHVSYESLLGEVPAGVEPGLYDLRVETPAGQSVTLPDAFTVTDTRADHLDLSVATAAYVVGAYAGISIQLRDPTELEVAQTLEVEVTVTSPTGAAGVSFYPDGLEDQERITGGVRGRLSVDGSGHVLLTSEAADDVRVEVNAVDDTVVRGDSLLLSWDPGPVARVELALPRANFRAIAGDPFNLVVRLLDEHDNVLTSEPADLIMLDACGGWVDPFVSVVGEGTLEITLESACAEDRIYAYAFGQQYESEPFAVLAGDVAGYQLQTTPTTVVAGEPLVVLAQAVDAFDNPVEDHLGVITLSDDVGGLDPDLAIGEQSCPGFVSGGQLCTARLWKASSAVVVRAEDEAGVYGDSGVIVVLAADPTTVVVSASESRVEAGEEFEVTVRVLDGFGNSVGFDPAGTDPVTFDDTSGTIGCTWVGPSDGGQAFTCTIEGAETDAHISAAVLGLQGTAGDSLRVVNGPLGLVELEPLTTEVVAGEALTLEVRGFDVYGNPYLVQSDPVVRLSDSVGTISPATSLLGSTGTAQLSVVLTGAGTSVRIYGSQSSVRLGASRGILVTAAALDSIAVDAPPWISVDEPTDVAVTAIDAYGNPILDYAGVVTLEPTAGSCDTWEIETFTLGSATVEMSCGTPTLSEMLVALDEEGVGGSSAVIDVVDLACAGGPTAVLELDGGGDTVRCLAEGATVDIDADTASSVAGSVGIAIRHFLDSEGTLVRTLSADQTFTYEAAGTRTVQALVVDSLACADLAEGTVYVGMDDGEPTGPITVTLSASSTTSAGSVTASVSADDCTGDVAAGQELYVRADLGEPGLPPTGGGLVAVLDGTGSDSFTWDFDAGYSGTATLYVGSASGGGGGSASVAVTGDSRLPQVVSVDPSGTVLEDIPTLVVVFDEPMYARNISATYITLAGPSGNLGATFALSTDGETATITPDTPLDGSAGTYTLTLSQSVRDAAGNQLDGSFSSTRGSFVVTMGDVGSSLPAVSSCDFDPEAFAPDGDDGLASEADSVAVTPTATAAPEWWWLVVQDPSGARVRSLRSPGTETEVVWDGRGDDGLVVPAGVYGLVLQVIDSDGNVGEGCDGTVTLEQHVGAR